MGIFLCKNVHAGTFGNQEVGSGQRSVVGGEQGNEEEGFDVVHKTNDFGTKVEKKCPMFFGVVVLLHHLVDSHQFVGLLGVATFREPVVGFVVVLG